MQVVYTLARHETLGVGVTFPKGLRYLETPDLDGVALLSNDDVIRDILEFSKTRVATPTTFAVSEPEADRLGGDSLAQMARGRSSVTCICVFGGIILPLRRPAGQVCCGV